MIQTSTNPASTAEITFDNVMAVCRKLKAIQPKLSFDCLCCVQTAFDRFKAEVVPADETNSILSIDRLCGIPVYVFPTETEAVDKACELMLQGKRVAVLNEKGGMLTEFKGLGDYVRQRFSRRPGMMTMGDFNV